MLSQKENVGANERTPFLRIIARTLQTVDVKLVSLTSFWLVVLGAFAAGVTIAWRHSSEDCIGLMLILIRHKGRVYMET